MAELTFNYLKASKILAHQDKKIKIFMVGCGGTGSFMGQHISRLTKTLLDSGRETSVYFIDPDVVEEKNIGRQLFSYAELGCNKAETLAFRYNGAYGLDIIANPGIYKHELLSYPHHDLNIIVGCVDNSAARKEISESLISNYPTQAASIWWLDCGNGKESGQVLLGNAPNVKYLEGSFKGSICTWLPSPALQAPNLIAPKPKPDKKQKKLSCAELAMMNLQSLNINAHIAAIAADMLTRLLLTNDLKKFAVNFDLPAGVMSSLYATPEEISRITNKSVDFLKGKEPKEEVAQTQVVNERQRVRV